MDGSSSAADVVVRDPLPDLDLRVLGSLSVVVDAVDLTPSAGKLRQLLALLLFSGPAGITPSMARCELWTEAPDGWQITIRSYLSLLRSELAVGGGLRASAHRMSLHGRHGRYRLEKPAGVLDLERYRTAVTSARARELDGDLDAAARWYDAALDVWRGDVLEDVACGSWLRAAISDLQHDHAAVLSDRIDCHILLGRSRSVVGDLARLALRRPSDERVVCPWMIALHETGQRARAL